MRRGCGGKCMIKVVVRLGNLEVRCVVQRHGRSGSRRSKSIARLSAVHAICPTHLIKAYQTMYLKAPPKKWTYVGKQWHQPAYHQ